jgi:hypothetical protein
MDNRKFKIVSNFFDQTMGNVIEIRSIQSSYDTYYEEYYTEKYMNGDEPSYIITDGGNLILDGNFIELIKSMFDLDKSDLIEFASYKFKRKITSVI